MLPKDATFSNNRSEYVGCSKSFGHWRLSMEASLLAKHLLAFFLLLISLTLHEWAHAWVAYRCGDETPKAAGRVTLNPLAHIDLFGTVLFPLICIFSQSGLLFGWGKVVPMNPRNFDRRWKFLFAGGAGIFGNLLLCFIASLLLTVAPNFALIAFVLLQLNAVLIVFNIIPLPGLDGFYLLQSFARLSTETVRFLERWGFLILLFLIQVPLVRMILMITVEGIMNAFIVLSAAFF